MKENNFNFTNGVSYDAWYEQKRLIDQLKHENEELKKYKVVVDELAGKQIILTNKDKMPELYKNAKDLALERYHKVLKEIKKIINDDGCNSIRELLLGHEVATISDSELYEQLYFKLNAILDNINKADFWQERSEETRPSESCVEPVEIPIIQKSKGGQLMIRDIENCREVHLGHGTVGVAIDTTGTVEVLYNKPSTPVGSTNNEFAGESTIELKEKNVCLFFDGREGIAALDILIHDLQKIRTKLKENV